MWENEGEMTLRDLNDAPPPGIYFLTLWQAERHFFHLRCTGAATILSFGISMFTSLDSIGSAVGKRPIGHAIATSEWPTEC